MRLPRHTHDEMSAVRAVDDTATQAGQPFGRVDADVLRTEIRATRVDDIMHMLKRQSVNSESKTCYKKIQEP